MIVLVLVTMTTSLNLQSKKGSLYYTVRMNVWTVVVVGHVSQEMKENKKLETWFFSPNNNTTFFLTTTTTTTVYNMEWKFLSFFLFIRVFRGNNDYTLLWYCTCSSTVVAGFNESLGTRQIIH